ncbi:MAG TPA: MarR family transcriptional regulator [Candidatus Binatia bacterium]|nr:MarR family transcriptional regulator [Candidatus Binatia bacterium]
MERTLDGRGRRRTEELRAVMDALRRLVRALRLSARAAEKAIGISGAQLFVLQQLAAAPAESLGALAARTHTDQSSVSVVVRRLVERGLVARRSATADARRIEIALTAAGRALLRRAPEPAQTRLLDALQRLSPPRRRVLARALAEIARAAEPEANAPGMFFEDEIARRPLRRRPHA